MPIRSAVISLGLRDVHFRVILQSKTFKSFCWDHINDRFYGDVQSKLIFPWTKVEHGINMSLLNALFYIHPLELINTTPDGSGSNLF
nr:CNT_HP1_G0006270.mRNA.1.CDS.1 [Saccharomyces cerevisiae]